MTGKTVYAVYKGDKFLDLGTVEELSERFKVKKETVYFWSSPVNKRRMKRNRKIAIKIEEEKTNEKIYSI